MAKSKRPTVIKKTVKKEGPSTGAAALAALGPIIAQFVGGYSTNLPGAAGGSVKKTTIKRVH